MSPIADMVGRLIAAGAEPPVAAAVVVEAVNFGMCSSAEIRGKSVESPAEAALERRRTADKLRKRAKAATRKSAPSVCGNSAEILNAPSNLSSLTEPVLSREVATKEAPKTVQVEGRKRGIRLSVDWQPDEELRQFARAHNVDPDALRAEFVDYWIAIPGQRGCKTADRGWPATWRNRVRQIETFRKEKNGQGRPRTVQQAAADQLDRFRAINEPSPILELQPAVRDGARPSDVRLLPSR